MPLNALQQQKWIAVIEGTLAAKPKAEIQQMEVTENGEKCEYFDN
jgi:hypothetical protein